MANSFFIFKKLFCFKITMSVSPVLVAMVEPAWMVLMDTAVNVHLVIPELTVKQVRSIWNFVLSLPNTPNTVNIIVSVPDSLHFTVNVILPVPDTPYKYTVNVVVPVPGTPYKYMINVGLPLFDTPYIT